MTLTEGSDVGTPIYDELIKDMASGLFVATPEGPQRVAPGDPLTSTSD